MIKFGLSFKQLDDYIARARGEIKVLSHNLAVLPDPN